MLNYLKLFFYSIFYFMIINSIVIAAYPSKPIRLLVGFSAGGSADNSARIISAKISESLKGRIIVENRGGAGGVVAASIVANSASDGYTLLWSSPGALTISQILESNIPYKTATAFTPIGLAVTFCSALIVSNDSGITSIKSLIVSARDSPGKLQFATQGIGSTGHLAGELMQMMTGIKLVHIPYKGANEIMTAILGNEMQLGFTSSSVASAMRNRIKILAVTSLNRDLTLPDIPSMHESGLTNYEAIFWYGLLAPANIDEKLVKLLNVNLQEALNSADVIKTTRLQGLNAKPSSPQYFKGIIESDYQKWFRVIKH